MKKPEITRLKFPFWFQVLFFILTIVIPLGLVMYEGYNSPSGPFKLTFGFITSFVIVWAFIKYFLLNKIEKTINERKNKLEHDYEIDVGNKRKIRWLWFTNEQKLAVFDLLSVVLYGGLLAIVATGVASKLMAIRGAIVAIAISYTVAYIIKFVVISVLKGVDDNYETDKK